MLAEFFLTPDTFCESDENIRQLQTCLFPFGPNASVGVICHFGESEWEDIVGNRIVRIADHEQRMLAINLFERISDEIAVFRPPIAAPPNNETGWINTAKQSKQNLELDGLVVTQAIVPCPDDCVRLPEFAKSDYWEDFGNPRVVGRDTASQVPVLNSICAHSDWLIVRMPQVKGGNDDEIVTIKQIIQLANRLPAGYKKSDIIVEIPISEGAERAHGETEAAERLMRNVKGELTSEKVAGCDISVAIYPVKSFVNREIVAGEFLYDSDKNAMFKARWYLTMNHVAVSGKDSAKRNDANSWNLYSRAVAAKRLDELAGLKPVIPSETV